MKTGMLVDARLTQGKFQSSRQALLVQMMPTLNPTAWIRQNYR
jgi:hypothetical protein